jgi:hypothetical protein
VGDHHDNPRAIMEKNRPAGAQVVRVLKLPDGIEVIDQAMFQLGYDAEKQELVVLAGCVAMRESPIVGASRPVPLLFAEVARVKADLIREKLLGSETNGVSAEPPPDAPL